MKMNKKSFATELRRAALVPYSGFAVFMMENKGYEFFNKITYCKVEKYVIFDLFKNFPSELNKVYDGTQCKFERRLKK